MMARQDQENHLTVSITKTVSVYPKHLYPQKVMELSNLDRQCPLPMYLVLFYNNSHDCLRDLPISLVFERLKTGLEETLGVWYPAGGRLRLNSSDGKMNLWCNNEGAILVEAVTQLKISELGDLSLYTDFLENLVSKLPADFDANNISQMPLVAAQVTRFGCGGYSIGTGISHSLFDGPGAYDFLTSWASNSSIFKDKKGLDHDDHKLQIKLPVLERGRLLVGMELATNQPNSAPRALAIDHLYQLIMQAAASFEQIDQTDRKSYVFKTFHLSGSMIESLKKKVFSHDYESGISFPCSSFDVVSAHLWKARTKALSLSKEKMVCMQFSADVRKKLEPPLPKGFSGNAYVLASVALTVNQLEEATHKSIIEKIRKAKLSVNNEYVNAYKQGLEGPQQASLPPLKELTLVSDWTRMPFHKLDFLRGQAAYASPLLPPIPDVAYFLQNPNDSKSIDVRIGLLPEFVREFSSYFLADIL